VYFDKSIVVLYFLFYLPCIKIFKMIKINSYLIHKIFKIQFFILKLYTKHEFIN